MSEKWQLNALGLRSSDELRTEFERVRGRLSQRLEISRPVFSAAADNRSSKEIRGRKDKYKWVDAINTVWGQIYQGELTPKKQADVEAALTEALPLGDSEPSTGSVRPYASKIWKEMQRPRKDEK